MSVIHSTLSEAVSRRVSNPFHSNPPLPQGALRFSVQMVGWAYNNIDIMPDDTDSPADVIAHLRKEWPDDWMRASCSGTGHQSMGIEISRQWNAHLAASRPPKVEEPDTRDYRCVEPYIREPSIPVNYTPLSYIGDCLDAWVGADREQLALAIEAEGELVDDTVRADYLLVEYTPRTGRRMREAA
jgi:hypothetical protein